MRAIDRTQDSLLNTVLGSRIEPEVAEIAPSQITWPLAAFVHNLLWIFSKQKNHSYIYIIMFFNEVIFLTN